LGKREPLAEIYQLKKEGLAELERLAEAGGLELLYGDASRISEHPVVPYGWQFAAEEVFMPAAAQGASVNLFGFISRANRLVFEMTAERITARFVIGMVEKVLEQLRPPTVIVLDNASAHRAAAVRERLPGWAERGLFVFYLPVYSRHLNIAETLWRKLKYEWLEPADYFVWEQLKYWTRLLLSAVGSELKINYSAFSC
jgi:transposase